MKYGGLDIKSVRLVTCVVCERTVTEISMIRETGVKGTKNLLRISIIKSRLQRF